MPIVDLDDELSIVDEEDNSQSQAAAATASQVDGGVGDESVVGMIKEDDMSAMEDMSTMSGSVAPSRVNSEDEREQQWIIDSILNTSNEPSNGNSNHHAVSESETDDDSLYIMDLDTNDKSESKKETPKMRNVRRKSPPAIDTDYQNYMNVSSIVDDFGEDEAPKGWKSKVLGGSKSKTFAKKQQPAAQEQAKDIKPTKSDKGGWRTKSLFRGSKNNNTKKPAQEQSLRTKPQEQTRRPSAASSTEPYEANLAPLGGIDDIGADVKANEDTNAGRKERKEQGWMSSLLGSMHDDSEDDDPRNEQFENLYAATVAAPSVIGAVSQEDVEAKATVTDVQDVTKQEKEDQEVDEDREEPGNWGSRMSALISSATGPKVGPSGLRTEEDSEKSVTTQSVEDEMKTDDDDISTTSSIEVTDTMILANDIASLASTLTAETKPKNEAVEEKDDIVALATALTNKTKADKSEDDGIVALATSLTMKAKRGETDEEKGEMTDSVATNKGDVEEAEGSFVSSAVTDDLIVGWGNKDLAEIPEGTDDVTGSKKTWKTKVKSVRKSGSNKMSSIRKNSKLGKGFTQSKMNAMEAADGDTSTDSGNSGNGINSVETPIVAKGISTANVNRRKTVCIAVAALAFVALIVGAIVGALRNSSSEPQDDTPTPPPPDEIPQEDLMYLYELLLPISGSDDLTGDDPNSPHAKSFTWIAQDHAVRDDSDDVIIQRYVSSLVYYSLGGEDWAKQNNFLSHGDDLCNWNDAGSGIICSSNEVYELQLAENNLSGRIPEEIRQLNQLRSINMANNAIEGTLPDGIGGLDWLDELDLSSNQLSGSLPYSLFVFKQLRDIVLDDNNFIGTLPPTLGDNAVLERFSVKGNKLSGPFPRGIAQSPILKHVDLTDNEMSGELPEFATFASVRFLHLGRNDFEGTIPHTLAEIPYLESLHVEKNSFSGTVPRFITTSGSIRHLEIRDNDFKDSIQGIFNKLPPTIETVIASNNNIGGTIPVYINNYTLSTLRLEDNDIFGTIPSEIGACTELSQALHLSGNRFNGTIPVELGNLKKLTSLRLRINRLSGTVPVELGQLTLLKDIWLDANKLEGDIPEVLADLPDLHSLLLSENRGLSGDLEPFCSREVEFKRFGVNTCDDEDGLDCPCCNICCQEEDGDYGCFTT